MILEQKGMVKFTGSSGRQDKKSPKKKGKITDENAEDFQDEARTTNTPSRLRKHKSSLSEDLWEIHSQPINLPFAGPPLGSALRKKFFSLFSSPFFR